MSDSSTSLERLVHLFGYAICSFERPQISMRFAIRISKGITLSCCYPIQLSRNRRPRKGRQSCQTLTFVSSGLVPIPVDPTRLTRTRSLTRFAAWKRSAGPNCFAACRDRGFYVPAVPLSTTARLVVNFRTRLTIPYRTIVDNRSAALSIPIRLLHNLLCRFELRLVFQRSRTAQGPARTTLPEDLFHRFRRVTTKGDEIIRRA
jgi:hypothetical protein